MNKIKIPSRKIIYGKQFIDRGDIIAVKNSLLSPNLTTGPLTSKFEKNIAKYLKVKFSYSCNSGTSALLLSLLSLNVKKGDNIILPSVNFVAAANMAKFLGANIFFADIDPNTGQSEPKNFNDCIKLNKIKKIKAFIVMYNGGYPRNVIDFWKLKNKFKCFLIEDACHAFGSSYLLNDKNIKIGSCLHSDICTFSLHPLKTITTFEGGIVTTNSKKISDKIKLFRSHGIERSKKYWNYDVKQVGFNFRLSDVACSPGISQLKKISYILNYRKKIFNFYLDNIHNFCNLIKIVKPEPKTSPSFHLILAKIEFKKLRLNRDKLFYLLNKKKIFCQFHYIPNYKFKNFKKKEKLNGAEKFYKTSISIPIHLGLVEKDLKYIIKTLKSIFLKNLK